MLATNAFPPLLRRLRSWIVPVYDYALMTEPLTEAQRDAIGWRHRQGLADTGNQFHYYRLTADNRILFGGYDAVYHYGNRVAPALEQREATFTTLASHFFSTFPTRRAAVQSPLGWRHRHLHPVLRVLRHRVLRTPGVRRRIHRARRRRDPVRGPRDARPALRHRHPADPARPGAPQAAAVPAGTGPVRGHQPHPMVARPRRRARRSAQPLAPYSRPSWTGFDS
ncbi:FAD-dependent oxidoreductase [Micromonospora sp. BRA006-A]|nr:FAD-dependent oxidoreductase [Micromonospora sp. BRA006-A]